ncbi:uncharacterized protein LOC107264439 [Cephus cinctus]|uniref:Uncharacterized protein LOC107264439 n=1 Tax=Cephus cinctus TaxID=211228 RepID=A0AAJ7FER2_CEPCN|nr:uncharacterized protein LOC107264439 [Cephus cinctus]
MGRLRVAVVTLCVLLARVQSLKLADPCNEATCKLPECKCSGTDSNSKIPIDKIPQIVLLTFDDAVNYLTYDYFQDALFDLKNPDGCPIGVTHFLSHEYTDYTKVHDLWKRGHEIALHSVSHSAVYNYWRNIDVKTFSSEFGDMRKIVNYFAKIPSSELRGVRLPFLQTSGNVSFQAMKELGLLYDSSLPSIHFVNPPLWPYSLDYQSIQDCVIEPCPTASFPGVWEIPMTVWEDQNNIPCSMVDSCLNIPETGSGVAQWMIQQFEKYYKGSRAPFPVFMHASWFSKNEEYFKAYKLFIKHLQSLPDVYLVNMNKAIEWIKNPKPLTAAKPFGNCEVRKPEAPCPTPLSCGYYNQGSEIWMTSCASKCPANFPWLGNPLGN